MNSALSEAEVLKRACHLAKDYHIRNMSPFRLMVDSGYSDRRAAITEEKIKSYISENPDVIGDWIGYSMNKRCSGWYFTKDPDRDQFVIGNTDHTIEERFYSEPLEPCARYIKLELESIAR